MGNESGKIIKMHREILAARQRSMEKRAFEIPLLIDAIRKQKIDTIDDFLNKNNISALVENDRVVILLKAIQTENLDIVRRFAFLFRDGNVKQRILCAKWEVSNAVAPRINGLLQAEENKEIEERLRDSSLPEKFQALIEAEDIPNLKKLVSENHEYLRSHFLPLFLLAVRKNRKESVRMLKKEKFYFSTEEQLEIVLTAIRTEDTRMIDIFTDWFSEDEIRNKILSLGMEADISIKKYMYSLLSRMDKRNRAEKEGENSLGGPPGGIQLGNGLNEIRPENEYRNNLYEPVDNIPENKVENLVYESVENPPAIPPESAPPIQAMGQGASSYSGPSYQGTYYSGCGGSYYGYGANTQGTYSVAIGSQAGYTYGSEAVAIGHPAGYTSNGPSMSIGYSPPIFPPSRHGPSFAVHSVLNNSPARVPRNDRDPLSSCLEKLSAIIDTPIIEGEEDSCCVCVENKAVIVFNCGHKKTCAGCSISLINGNRKCPVCREGIVFATKVF